MRHTLLYILGLFVWLCNMHAQSSVDTKIAVNSQNDDNTFVVIISNENYKHEEHVPFAKNDGEVFKVYCQKTLGIPESNIRYVPDATLNEMNFEIDWLGDVLNAYEGDARGIIYYTGHGMPDENSKEAYLLPVDGYSKSPSSGMSTKSLYEKLRNMHSNSIMVFLDACFSGAKRDGKMLASSRGVAIRVRQDPVGDNTVVFSAAQGDETAYPYKSQQHGMFTYFILDKLQQSGGYTTLGELCSYVTTQVKRKSVVVNGKSQTPSVVVSSVNKDWRNWRFASKVAKRYETRATSGTTTQVQRPATPLNTPDLRQNTSGLTSVDRRRRTIDSIALNRLIEQELLESQEVSVQSYPSKSSTPRLSMNVANELVVQGKKEMRAMNYNKAKASFTQAANQGSLEAFYQLGMLYSNSNYDGYNRETATNYFLKAANNRHVEAMYQAGMMYLGIDNSAAKLWLRKASEQGHDRARAQLSRLK